MGFGASLLPFVPVLDAHAAPAVPPKRIVFFFTTNGTIHESWVPKMAAGKLVLSPILGPLEKLKSNLMEVRARGGELIVFSDPEAGIEPSDGVTVIQMPRHVTYFHAPVMYTIP